MDDPGIGGEELRRTLAELEVINRLLGGYRPSVAGIGELLPPDSSTMSLLDVGCGAGDGCRQIVAWARSRGIRARVHAIDVSPETVGYSKEKSRSIDEIEHEVADLFDVEGESRFDVVHGALVLHHFDGGDAVRALRRMYDLSRWGVVVNDLHRHPLAYWSIRISTRLFSRSPLIRHDAPLSVEKAFVRSEWSELTARAGLPAPRVSWRWAFRWQVVVAKAERDA